MTTVYYTLCKKLPQDVFLRTVASLPSRMQKRLSRFRRWQDAHAYLYGKLLLKEGLLQCGFQNTLESMKETPFGKPYFADSPFTFNVSHTDDLIVCVISTEEHQHLGIDVEKILPIDITDFNCVFSPAEQKLIDSYEQFYTYWTRKEAIIKADGRGMQIPLKAVDTTRLSVMLGGQRFYLLKVDVVAGYIVHIASLAQLDGAATVDMHLSEQLDKVCQPA